jgi:hypothetical protein
MQSDPGLSLSPAPPGLTAPTDTGPNNEVLKQYCAPLETTGEKQEYCTADFKGYGFDPRSKSCVLVNCDHVFGARYPSKADCEEKCDTLINATQAPLVSNPYPPIDYLWEPNVVILMSAEAWMKQYKVHVVSLPERGAPILKTYNNLDFSQLFRISKEGVITSLSGRTLRFADSEVSFWQFKPHTTRNLGPVAFHLEQKDRFLASQNVLMQISSVETSNQTLISTWFVIPVGVL